jgi:hypothetical protein
MKLKFWIGIVVSVVCLYIVFRGIDSHKVLEALKSVNYFYLTVAALINLSSFLARAERWKYLLEPIKKIRTANLFPIIMIGFMATNVLPARAGEFVRAYGVGKKEAISKSASFATIVLERIFDSIVILVLLVSVFFFIDFKDTVNSLEYTSGTISGISPMVLKTTGFVFMGGLVALLVFLFLLSAYPTVAIILINKVLFPLPERIKKQIGKILESFSSGLQVLKKGSHLIPLLFWSFVVWGISIIYMWLTFRAFGLNLPFYAATFILVLTAFAVALPSSPGFIGPFHAASSAGLIFFSVDKSMATGVSLILHLVTVVPVIVLGIFYLWMENLSFSEIKRA